MGNFGPVEIVLIIINVIVSYIGFNNRQFFDKYLFRTGAVTYKKDYKRLLTSGFLHVSGMHLLFNMLTLYFFAGVIEKTWGSLAFFILYLLSLLGGNFLALLIQRHNPSYRAVGASGAVSGVLFAAIALFPQMPLYFMFIPIPIPAWVVGLGFIIYSIYGIRKQNDNIGHEAHLGGAIVGILMTVLLFPGVLVENLLTILLILLPVAAFIFVLIFRPDLIMHQSPDSRESFSANIEDRWHQQRLSRQQELDQLLEKVRNQGVESLTSNERKRLEELSE